MSDPHAQPYVAFHPSHRDPVPGAQLIGPAAPHEPVEVTVYLRRKSAGAVSALAQTFDPATFAPLSRASLAVQHGADPADIERIIAFAREHHLTVVHTDPARRAVMLAGTVATMSAAFHVTLQRYSHNGKTFRGRTGTIQIPADLASIVEGVVGLDNRRQAVPHVKMPAMGTEAQVPLAAKTFAPRDVAQLYHFPTAGTGAGQTIGIIELGDTDGGGYRMQDLRTFFKKAGVTAPTVTSVSVDGGRNAPTGNPNDPNSADVEIGLDIEVAGAVAPGAHIVVYFAPNTDQGFIDAISTAVHDTQHKPSVISISWGGPEESWSEQARTLMDQTFQDAALAGVTVCVAAGDHGSADGLNDGKVHVDFPASSPFALACGGTHLEGSGAIITQETVWNDQDGWATGGGISTSFPLPAWQQGLAMPASLNAGQPAGRGVPDVAGNADSQTGYAIYVDGAAFPVGGTSAVAPLYAGLIALINEQLGRPAGYLHPLLYQQAALQAAMRDVTSGDNGGNGVPGYSAGPGWDACTGWGSIDGGKLLDALRTHLPAPAADAQASSPARS